MVDATGEAKAIRLLRGGKMGLSPQKSPTVWGRWWQGKLVSFVFILAWFVGIFLLFVLVLLLLERVLSGPVFRAVLNLGPPISLGPDAPPVTIPALILTLAIVIPFVLWTDTDHYKRTTAKTTAPPPPS